MRILWEDLKQISPDSLVHDADEDEIFKSPSFLRRAGEAEHCGRFSVEVGGDAQAHLGQSKNE